MRVTLSSRVPTFGGRSASRHGEAGVNPGDVVGVGIDATCSLVVVDEDGGPVSIDPDGEAEQDVVVWMCHRATAEAQEINAGDYEVLQYVGGQVSPEMQTPKLLWLKRHLPEAWAQAKHFFDLPDYLTWRCTRDATRSLCSTVCKWTYLGHRESSGWDRRYFESIGLGDLADEGFARIGTRVQPMAQPLGEGLTAAAAADLGLNPGTAVGVSIIDAHAGGVGLLGGGEKDSEAGCFNRSLALIGGTSSCHMAVSPRERFVPGVWGPYYSAMIPGFWLNEGGQSATGALVDRIVFGHASSGEAKAFADQAGVSVYELLNDRLKDLAQGQFIDHLTRDLHVDPDFHGNRSPHADPTLRGTIAGLRLEQSLDDLALLYLATVQAVAYGTRHIIEQLNQHGYAIDTLAICGGGTKNPVFMQQHANATGCTLQLGREPEAVLLGSAMLGSVAAGAHADLPAAMSAMSEVDLSIQPEAATRDYHNRKYQVFHQMHEDQLVYRGMMAASDSRLSVKIMPNGRETALI